MAFRCNELTAVRVPLPLLRCKLLTPTERLIFAALPLLMGERGAIPSNAEVCETLGVCQITFTTALKRFRELGLIETRFDGRARYVVGGFHFLQELI